MCLVVPHGAWRRWLGGKSTEYIDARSIPYIYVYIYICLSLPPQRYRTESAAAVGLKAIGYVDSFRFLIFGAILLFSSISITNYHEFTLLSAGYFNS